MGFTDLVTKAKNMFAKDVRAFNAGETAVDSDLPWLATWFWTAKLGMPRKVNIMDLRAYGKSAWVSMVTNAIIKQVRTTPWRVVNSDEEDETDYTKDIEKVENLLANPNRNGKGFWSVWCP